MYFPQRRLESGNFSRLTRLRREEIALQVATFVSTSWRTSSAVISMMPDFSSYCYVRSIECDCLWVRMLGTTYDIKAKYVELETVTKYT